GRGRATPTEKEESGGQEEGLRAPRSPRRKAGRAGRCARLGVIRMPKRAPKPAALTVGAVAEFLDRFAPPELASEWDNVGLLLGDRAAPVRRVLTCLTVTPEVAAEAVAEKAQLIVTHHPILFRPVKRLTAGTPEGRMLLDLIRAGVAV